MIESSPIPNRILPVRLIIAGEDVFSEQRGLGVSNLSFKMPPQDSDSVFIVENSFHEKGGPARHLHYDQDEWFYAVDVVHQYIVKIYN